MPKAKTDDSTDRYWTMGREELEAENQRLDEEIGRLRAEKQAVSRALDIQINEEQAAARLAEMSDAEKIALRNVLARH